MTGDESKSEMIDIREKEMNETDYCMVHNIEHNRWYGCPACEDDAMMQMEEEGDKGNELFFDQCMHPDDFNGVEF